MHRAFYGMMAAMVLNSATASAATLHPVPFSALQGWSETQAAKGLKAFQRSCAKARTHPLNAYGRIVSRETWAAVCTSAIHTSDANAKTFFEHRFNVWRVSDGSAQQGLLTGYYTPTLQGGPHPSAAYPVPLYRRPDEALRTRYSRAEIESGALKGRGLELLWVSSAIDAFFLHIQGSGYVHLDNGETHKLVFAGKNDFPYTAIGRRFVQEGTAKPEEMSMQWLRHWLQTHPAEAEGVMRRNQSYIFFALGDRQESVKGAEGTVLTPQHSVAIDPAHIDYGALLYVETHFPDGREYNAIAVAQDTGSAIRGALRADLYTGVGDEAGELAGRLKSDAAFYVLLPRVMP